MSLLFNYISCSVMILLICMVFIKFYFFNILIAKGNVLKLFSLSNNLLRNLIVDFIRLLLCRYSINILKKRFRSPRLNISFFSNSCT